MIFKINIQCPETIVSVHIFDADGKMTLAVNGPLVGRIGHCFVDFVVKLFYSVSTLNENECRGSFWSLCKKYNPSNCPSDTMCKDPTVYTTTPFDHDNARLSMNGAVKSSSLHSPRSLTGPRETRELEEWRDEFFTFTVSEPHLIVIIVGITCSYNSLLRDKVTFFQFILSAMDWFLYKYTLRTAWNLEYHINSLLSKNTLVKWMRKTMWARGIPQFDIGRPRANSYAQLNLRSASGTRSLNSACDKTFRPIREWVMS